MRCNNLVANREITSDLRGIQRDSEIMGEVEFLFHHGRAFGYLAGLQIEGFAKTKRRGGDLRPERKTLASEYRPRD